MRLRPLKGGRDGRLEWVVSKDLAWFSEAHHIALQRYRRGA